MLPEAELVTLEVPDISDGLVVLKMTRKQAQAVYDKLYVYDESEGFIERGAVVQALQKAKAVPYEGD